MKKYVKITNKGATPRDFLKIMGAGGKDDKSDDNSVFGQFKSGYKFAGISALRRGLRVVASSADDEGRYTLEYKTRHKTINHNGKKIIISKIYYAHCDGLKIWTEESSFSLDSFSEWAEAAGDSGNEFYPILREYIANARDEDIFFKWEAGVEKITLAEPGETAVYIEETEAMLDILRDESGRYFKFSASRPIFEADGLGAIYPKSSDGETRYFNNGYLVECKKENFSYASLFDYEVRGKDISNEFRAINDKDKFYSRLAELFTRITDKNLLRRIIDSACACVDTVSTVEAKVLGYINEKDMPDGFKKMCLEIWEERCGKNGLLACRGEAYDYNGYMRALGYKVFSFVPYVNYFWAEIGAKDSKTAREERSEPIQYRKRTDEETARLADVARRYLLRIKHYKKLIEKCPVGTCYNVQEQKGLYRRDYSSIYLAEEIYKKKDISLIEVFVHELDHFETGLDDNDYLRLAQHKDMARAAILILLGAALDALEDAGVDISALHPEFVSTKKAK